MAGINTSIAKDASRAQIIDQSDPTAFYIGYAKIGTLTSAAKWAIQKVTVSGGTKTFQWANGVDTDNQIWDNRTSLTYS